jgi:hypothetical protein
MNLQPGQAFGNNGYYDIRPSPGKGNGAFALKDIAAGTRILVDQALFITNQPMPHVKEQDVRKLVSQLEAPARKQFLALPLDSLNCNVSEELIHSAKFYSNMFQIRGEPLAGCFCHASRFNNSCAPNCAITTTSRRQQQCRTIKDVLAGDELTFAYKEDYLMMPTKDRQEDMAMSGFRCQCNLCSLPAKERLLSDMRRRLMRHLAFTWRGKDLISVPANIDSGYVRRYGHYLARQKQYGYTWPMILQAKLAEAEGIICKATRFAYCQAIGVVVSHAKARKLRCLPCSSLMSVRDWSRRAQSMQRLHTGTETYNHDQAEQKFRQLCYYVDRIGPDRVL